MSEEKTPAMAAFAKYHERTAGAPLLMPDSWDMQPEAVRADWDATAEAVAPAYAHLLDQYREVLKRLADDDTQVLDSGLGGGDTEELHVRTNLARQVLGLKVCGCTECQVSLGLNLDDDEADL